MDSKLTSFADKIDPSRETGCFFWRILLTPWFLFDLFRLLRTAAVPICYFPGCSWPASPELQVLFAAKARRLIFFLALGGPLSLFSKVPFAGKEHLCAQGLRQVWTASREPDGCQHRDRHQRHPKGRIQRDSKTPSSCIAKGGDEKWGQKWPIWKHIFIKKVQTFAWSSLNIPRIKQMSNFPQNIRRV